VGQANGDGDIARVCAPMQVLVLTPKAALALCLRMQVLLVPPDTKISTVKETWGKQEGFTKLTQPQVGIG
jgi:hypothetical protein